MNLYTCRSSCRERRSIHEYRWGTAQLDSSCRPYHREAIETSTFHAGCDLGRLDAENDVSWNHAGYETRNVTFAFSNRRGSESETNDGNPENPSSPASHATHATRAENGESHGSSLTPNGYGHYEAYHFVT